jgi:hypothetical protein
MCIFSSAKRSAIRHIFDFITGWPLIVMPVRKKSGRTKDISKKMDIRRIDILLLKQHAMPIFYSIQ